MPLSCSDNRIERALQLAEKEMAVYKPSDSALIYLEMIDYPEKLSEKDFAKYILLLTGAHYRHKVTIGNDTLITAYKRNNDVRALSRSCLYAGRIWEVRENLEKATKYFSEAFELSTSSGDYKQIGKSAYGLGELYMDKADYRKSMRWLNLALSNFRESGSLFHEINTGAVRQEAQEEDHRLWLFPDEPEEYYNCYWPVEACHTLMIVYEEDMLYNFLSDWITDEAQEQSVEILSGGIR